MNLIHRKQFLPLLFAWIGLGMPIGMWAQQAYWVYLQDKGSQTEQRIEKGEISLSEAAITRRMRQGIALHSSDLPVYFPYMQRMHQRNIPIIAKSRWFNAVVAYLNPEALREVEKFPFVAKVHPVQSLVVHSTAERDPFSSEIKYGESETQIQMLGLEKLHEKGFTGKGVRIAIFDGGFREAHQLKVFSSLWENNKILAYQDFVRNRKDVFLASSTHGTHVWSTIAANINGKMVGAAVDADFVLGITELPATETRAEEYHWIEAMEWADSIGVDIIHSSLSYSQFDSQEDSYSFEDMDGNSTLVTQAADRAASKGIIVSTGAGNEGNDPWRRITAPCDGDSVLCIGAVNAEGEIAYFSSVGPSADGQVKPDVVAMGQNTAIASTGNTIRWGSGTSYSSPIVAGLAACLRQAHPNRHAMDIIQAIRLSGDRYASPDSLYGYGIPNASLADSLLRFVPDLENFVFQAPDIDTVEIDTVAELDTVNFFTEKPQSVFRIIADNLSVKTLESQILETRIVYGEDQVFFPPAALQKSAKRVVYDISHLLPGDYHIEIKTTSYEEWIKFSRK